MMGHEHRWTSWGLSGGVASLKPSTPRPSDVDLHQSSSRFTCWSYCISAETWLVPSAKNRWGLSGGLGKNGRFWSCIFPIEKIGGDCALPCWFTPKNIKGANARVPFFGWRPKSLVFFAFFADKQSFDFCEGLTARQCARKHAIRLAQSLVIYNTLHEPVHNQGTVFFHCPAPRKSSLITNAPWLHSRFMISFLFEGFGFRVASRHFQQLRTTSYNETNLCFADLRARFGFAQTSVPLHFYICTIPIYIYTVYK